jgi:hypothetical protein
VLIALKCKVKPTDISSQYPKMGIYCTLGIKAQVKQCNCGAATPIRSPYLKSMVAAYIARHF